MSKKRKRNFVFAGLVLSLLLIMFLYAFYIVNTQTNLGQGTSISEFKKEYVLIAEGKDSQFWQKVYESGQKEAEKHDAYLEWMEQSFSYSMVDYLKIAIQSNVDGILICPDGSNEVMQLLISAREQGIPVVTLVNDAPSSGRISCVGLNAYQLGKLYANKIIANLKEDTKNVMILQDERDLSNKDIIFNQIKSTIREYIGEDRDIDINSYSISSGNTFDLEEEIRDIFVRTDALPDILVCLSDADTQAACQAIVDHNQVGNIEMFGYFISDTALSSIQKGILQATIAPDTDQIGKDGILTLEEYKTSGYVSEYTGINLKVVTQDNVQEYVREQAKDEKTVE